MSVGLRIQIVGFQLKTRRRIAAKLVQLSLNLWQSKGQYTVPASKYFKLPLLFGFDRSNLVVDSYSAKENLRKKSPPKGQTINRSVDLDQIKHIGEKAEHWATPEFSNRILFFELSSKT